jgi:hypothetical protein
MILQMHKNMDVKLEYFYSLHQKIRSSYNFTQLSRIKLWWCQSINKQTNKQNFVWTKKWITTNQIFSLHVIKWFFCFSNLNISFFELSTKNKNNVCNMYSSYFTKSQQASNLQKTTISLFIIYIIFWHQAQVHNNHKFKSHNLIKSTTMCHIHCISCANFKFAWIIEI